MAAPALVLLAEGSSDPRVEQVFLRLRHEMQSARPALSVHLAFTNSCSPSSFQVVSSLVNREVAEVVFVPMQLCYAASAADFMQENLAQLKANHPNLLMELARPIGPAVELLSILDLRLRHALSTIRATELDGLVLSVPNWGDTRGSALLGRRARQWSAHHKLPVQLAYGDGSGSDVISAITALREMGRRNIAVGSFYLAPSDEYLKQTEQALAAGAIAISAPLGANSQLCDLIMTRYAFAAMDLLDQHPTDELPVAPAVPADEDLLAQAQ